MKATSGLFGVAAAVMLPCAALAIDIDGIAARVGTDSILRSDIFAEMQRMRADNSKYAEVRNEMIDRKLILKAALEAKMTMQEWVVENRVREIIKNNFSGDRNRLIEMLAKHKMSYPEWYAKTKQDMIVAAMRWNVVDKNVSASPLAMRQEYEQNRSKYVKDAKVSVTVIMLKPEESSRRDEISAALKSKTFEDLGGKKYVDVVATEVFQPEIVEEIEKMPKKTISHWIQIDGWSFLIRKDEETQGKALSFDEALDEIEAAVKESEAKRLYTAWLERLRSETYIKVY